MADDKSKRDKRDPNRRAAKTMRSPAWFQPKFLADEAPAANRFRQISPHRTE